MTAFVLVSAILVGINDRGAGPEIATNEKGEDTLTQPQELFTFDLSSPSAFEPATSAFDLVQSNVRRRLNRPNGHAAVYKPRRQSRPLPQVEQPRFVPTTLVIYAENGVINTRIEPWLQASPKKTPTSND